MKKEKRKERRREEGVRHCTEIFTKVEKERPKVNESSTEEEENGEDEVGKRCRIEHGYGAAGAVAEYHCAPPSSSPVS